ncbi:Flp family type IVb pilin [Azonexus sp.]|uniref:Flp family type IVb pilin n=1 Tax=Azonexus sp. TaxID=1872668 RepID=UPI0035AF4254
MKAKFIQFLRDEEGATAIEYALVAAMVALVLVTFIDQIQYAVKTIFTAIQKALVVPS